MEPATRFYIKKKEDRWSPLQDVYLNSILDKYKFYPDTWFTKKIFPVILWVLRKLNLKAPTSLADEVNMTYVSYTIHSMDIMDLLYKHKIDMSYIWNEKPQYLVMGNDIFKKLTGYYAESFGYINQELKLYRKYKYYDDFDAFNNRPDHYDTEITFWGFKVLIVPWINGMFLLPNI